MLDVVVDVVASRVVIIIIIIKCCCVLVLAVSYLRFLRCINRVEAHFVLANV